MDHCRYIDRVEYNGYIPLRPTMSQHRREAIRRHSTNSRPSVQASYAPGNAKSSLTTMSHFSSVAHLAMGSWGTSLASTKGVRAGLR